MIAHFKQDFYNKSFIFQDQGKEDEIVTLENRIKISLEILSNAQGSVPDNLYDYEKNDERLDYFVSGAKIFPEFAEVKKIIWYTQM